MSREEDLVGALKGGISQREVGASLLEGVVQDSGTKEGVEKADQGRDSSQIPLSGSAQAGYPAEPDAPQQGGVSDA